VKALHVLHNYQLVTFAPNIVNKYGISTACSWNKHFGTQSRNDRRRELDHNNINIPVATYVASIKRDAAWSYDGDSL
jgi:hypothetical protein